MEELFLGIDVGTQGVRAVLADTSGEVLAQASKRFPHDAIELPDGWREQDPALWWEKTKQVISEVSRSARRNNIDIKRLKAVAVTSTSGTVIPLDKDNNVLRRAIMYNDIRAAGEELSPCSALERILWIKKNEPDIFSRTGRFVSPADYIVGHITGNFKVSDTSNVLKMGYDLINKKWPSSIERFGIDPSLLPEVKLPGEVIGEVREEVEKETGIPKGVMVCAGATDGVAGFFASGAVLPGEWNSTLGTTLVVKGVSEEMLKDKLNRFYSHLHPQGYWLFGGASSCGGESLKVKFKGKFDILDEEASAKIPTKIIVYPLVKTGERCPFVNSNAQGFMIGKAKDKADLYTAYLEGVGLVEKWIYETIEELGAKVGEEIHVTGGGAKSNIWLKVRANILNKTLIRPKVSEACFGAAIIASSRTVFQDISQAVKAMVKKDYAVQPEKELVKIYETKYRKFRQACDIVKYGG